MKKLINILFLGFIFLSACKKSDTRPYTLTGKVTGANGQPVANASVRLSAYYPGNILSGGNYYRIATVMSDKNGDFKGHFAFDSTAKNFMIRVIKDKYFPYYNDNIFKGEVQNNVLNKNLIIYRLSTIKINFKNTPPSSPSDYFNVYQTNEMWSPSFSTSIKSEFTGGTYEPTPYYYTGSDIQGYELSKTRGDTYTVISWYSNKSGITKYGLDSIYIKGGEQGNYDINY